MLWARSVQVGLVLCTAGVVLAACASGPAGTGPTTTAPATPVDGRPVLHVAADGDDDGPGTRDAPLRTIERASELAEPGTLVQVAPGIYEGSVTTEASGTDDARITYAAEPAGAAEVRGTGGEGAAWRNRGDYVDIVGFTITGDAADGLISEGSFVRILANRVSGFGEGNCITTARSGYTLHDIDVIGNVAHGCGESALDHGIYVSHPRGTVANNIAYGNTGFGIHCWHNCNELVITNNLVFDNDEGGILIGQGDSPNEGSVDADGFVVANNIAVDNGNYGIEESGATGSNNRYLNNNVFGNEAGPMDLQTGQESGTLNVAPEFVDYRPDGSGDYRLRAESPIIDAGTSVGVVDVDFAGRPRQQGDAVDIGVYEH